MGLLHSIKKFFASPPLVTRLDELEPGRAIVEGEVRTTAPMASPLKGKPCVGFVYVATHEVSVRGGRQERLLRTVEGFCPFALELEGGRIEARPRTPGDFTQRDHAELAGRGYPGFAVKEEVVPPRARVRLHGVVRRDGDAWVMTYQRIVSLDAPKKRGKKRDARG